MESDLDLPPEIAYRTYDERWQLIRVNPSVEKTLTSLELNASADSDL